MRRALFLTTFLCGFLLASAGARAETVCFGGDLGPGDCSMSDETKVFLEKASDVTSGYGRIGSKHGLTLMAFTSTDSLDFGKGYRKITAASSSAFDTLDITIPDHSFTEISFDLKMDKVKRDREAFTVEAFDGPTLEGTYTYTPIDGLTHNVNAYFIVQALAGSLIRVELTGSTGFLDARHFQVSGVASVPEASTWMMVVAGFSGLGFAAHRTSRKRYALDP